MNPRRSQKITSRRSQSQLLQGALRAALRCTLGPNEDREPALEALAELPVEAPSAFQTAYAMLAGCTIVPDQGMPTDIFDIDELVSAHERFPDALPGALFFAHDGNVGWYFIDTAGTVAGTPGAVLWTEHRPLVRGDIDRIAPGNTVRVARDLSGFLHAATRGDLQPRRRPSVDDSDAAELEALMKGRGERWVGAPARDVVERFEAGIRLGCRITGDLEVVLSISDGIELPYAHVVIWPVERIERAGASDGLPEEVYGQVSFPTGFWIGTRGERQLLCCTGHTGWRGFEENTVVAVAPGESIEDAPVLGRLGTLVRTWVG